MKLSIRTRLSLVFTGLSAALLILFGWTVYTLMASNLERELREDTQHDLTQVLGEFKKLPWEKFLVELDEESEEFSLTIQVVDNEGRSTYRTTGIAEWDWPVDKNVAARAAKGRIWSDAQIGDQDHLVLSLPLFPPGRPHHILQIANSRADKERILNQLIACVNIGTLIVIAAVAFAGHYFSKHALAPVEDIREAADHITASNLTERLTYDGPPDELMRLTSTLNGLLNRVQEALERLQRFVADASHELRIPLTGLRGTIEIALRRDRSPEEYKQALETALSESEHMSEMVSELLMLARGDAGAEKIEKTTVALRAFMENLTEEANALNAEGRVQIECAPVPDLSALFDEAKIYHALINLLENAIKYNKPGGRVALAVRHESDHITFDVSDTGIGLADADKKRIFERFYRVDRARSRQSGGTGLGLSIASQIARAHGGSLTVESRLGEGSTFRLTIPHIKNV